MQSDASHAALPAIPLAEPLLHGNEWRYLKECLDTNLVSSIGPFVSRFENDFASYLGTPHAVSTMNGTAALHIALLIAGVQPDDEVLAPSLTFIAPVNAIRYAGAVPVIVDVDPAHAQLDAERVVAFLEGECERSVTGLRDRTTGRRVSAILPVHLLGHPVDMDPLIAIARKYDLHVIEDATESLGALYKGRPVGTLGDVGCFSFNGNKLITTGGGGMLVTDDPDRASRARYLTTQAKDDPVEFVHCEVGYNYRLTNLQAAVGCAQLENVDAYIRAKRAISARYAAGFGDLPGISSFKEAGWAQSACWLSSVRVDPKRFGLDSRELMNHLGANGIQSRPLWQPIHLSPAHSDAVLTECPVAECWNRETLSLPSSVGLSTVDQTRVIDCVRAATLGGKPKFQRAIGVSE